MAADFYGWIKNAVGTESFEIRDIHRNVINLVEKFYDRSIITWFTSFLKWFEEIELLPQWIS